MTNTTQASWSSVVARVSLGVVMVNRSSSIAMETG